MLMPDQRATCECCTEPDNKVVNCNQWLIIILQSGHKIQSEDTRYKRLVHRRTDLAISRSESQYLKVIGCSTPFHRFFVRYFLLTPKADTSQQYQIFLLLLEHSLLSVKYFSKTPDNINNMYRDFTPYMTIRGVCDFLKEKKQVIFLVRKAKAAESKM